jgi:hypothetical protein
MEAFNVLLQEKMAELEADDAAQAALASDPLEQFRLATQHAVLESEGRALPRQGHQAYIIKTVPSENPDRRHLDILS